MNWRTISSSTSCPMRRDSHGEPFVIIHQRKRVGPLAVEDLPRIERVAERLRHLPAVRGDQVSEAHDVAVRRRVEVQHALGHERVEPAARLVDRLGDEVGGEPLGEHRLAAAELGVVAPLRERHRAGVVPRVDHLLDARRGLAALRARERHVVDRRSVRVDVAHVASGEIAELRRASRSRSGDRPRTARSAAACPSSALARDRPVHVVLQPVAVAPVLDVVGDPVHGVVHLEQALLHRGRPDVPGGPRVIQERGAASPAERDRRARSTRRGTARRAR